MKLGSLAIRAVWTVSGTIGGVLFLWGLVVLPFAILGLVDPIGAQGSDDQDPFGTPRSQLWYAMLTIIHAAIAVSGWLLFRRAQRATQQGAPADAPASRESPRAFGPRRG